MIAEDPALLAAFLDESRESLAGLESCLVGLDSAPDLRSAVDAIFRPVHTLKGNAPFFGLMELQQLAHALETVLDHLRKGRLARSQAVTDVLLAGLDGLRACIDRLSGGGPEVADAQEFAALVQRLTSVGGDCQPTDSWARVFAGLLDLELHDDHADPANLERIRRLRQELEALRSVAVEAPGGGPVALVRQRLAKSLDAPLPPAEADSVIAALRGVRTACPDQEWAKQLDELLATCQVFVGSVGFDELLRRHVLEFLDRVALSPTPAAAAPSPTTGRTKEPTSERIARTETESHGKSMRVSEAAVDGFLEHVGEMLVIGDQMEHLQRRLSASAVEGGLIRDMRQAVASFGILSSELQRSIMAVRRVTVRAMLQKAPRLARDIAQAQGKDIAVVIRGETTEVDKGRLDLLDGPLTHLVRNCADHGIESPADREAAGKPARGTIALSASADDGWFILEIADDGRGLDLEAIRRKGEALGLVRPDAPLDERAIVELIFASGLSTAAAVTDVSGRGVGMDVVRRQISDAGGSITVATTRGAGTTFRIRLPSAVSTQIIPAFLVRDGAGVFALPLDLVRESFADASVQAGEGGGIVIRHGSTLPVARLARILGQDSAAEADAGRRIFVTIERHGQSLALSVDEILGVRRLVIRPLNGVTGAKGRFQGASLLGDGSLALVVDPDHLLAWVGRGGRHA